jgi:hypothetical protein
MLALAVQVIAQEPVPSKKYRAGEAFLEGSRVYVHVFKKGLGHEHAVMGGLKSGRIHLAKPGEHENELVFDLVNFVADADAARKYVGLAGTTKISDQQEVTTVMLGHEVLHTARYPTATFKIVGIKKLSSKSERDLPQFELDGQFTLQATTRPLKVIVDVQEQDHWQRLRGTISILQTDFGIKPYTKAFGAIGVADKLEILGDIWVAKAELTTEP